MTLIRGFEFDFRKFISHLIYIQTRQLRF